MLPLRETSLPHACAQTLAEADALARHERHGVRSVPAVGTNLKVEVATGGVSGRSHAGDSGSDSHTLTVGDVDAAVNNVTVGGAHSTGVFDDDVVAVAAIPAITGIDDSSARCRVDRGTTASANVSSLVEA